MGEVCLCVRVYPCDHTCVQVCVGACVCVNMYVCVFVVPKSQAVALKDVTELTLYCTLLMYLLAVVYYLLIELVSRYRSLWYSF